MKMPSIQTTAGKAIIVSLVFAGLVLAPPDAIPQVANDTLTRGLALHYPFTGDMKDASGKGNDATGGSGVTFGPDRHGVPGSALRFNGAGAFARSGKPPQISGQSPRTISLWFSPEGSRANFAKGSVAGILLQWGSGSYHGADCVLMLGAFGEIVVNGHYCTLESKRNVVPRRGWSHLVFVYPGNFQSAKFILNGQLLAVERKGSVELNTPDDAPVTLGRNGSNGKSAANLDDGWSIPWCGLIDEVRIYDRALDLGEVKTLFETERGKGGAESLMAAAGKNGNAAQSPTVPGLPPNGLNVPTAPNATGNSAQTATSTAIAAPALPVPTNNVVELSHGKGEVIVFDAKGVSIKLGGGYKRIPMKDLTESDLRALLETAKGYQAVTGFKAVWPRSAGSEGFEVKLDDFWARGTTLQGKISARFALFEHLRGYNATVATYSAQVGHTAGAIGRASGATATASNAESAADAAANRADAADSVKRDAAILGSSAKRIIGVSSSGAKKEAKAADQAFKAAEQAENAAFGAAIAAQNAAINNAARARTTLAECGTREAALISLGFPLSKSDSYGLIPSLSATQAIDMERGKKVIP